MTTLAAVKKGKRLCIASDSLALFGFRKEITGIHVEDEGKIIQIGPNYVGIAGHPSWNLIFTHYFSKEKKINEWKTPDQIFDVFNLLHRDLKDLYHFSPSYSRYESFESSDLGLLIVNSHGIFEVDYLRTVRQFSQFSAMGTGEEYALGAIGAIYSILDDVAEITKVGIEAAIQFDKNTEGPLDIHIIDSPHGRIVNAL
ncbi:MAG: hypothetical protein WB791_05315 [Waddliaceae bacterium]